jgi:type IV fimbrial biogenesis protein FimT
MKPRGFTLVEIAVTLTVLAVLLTLAVPGFGQWLRNQRVRAGAESILAGLQLAKAEAIKRNTTVRFSMVSSLASGCALIATSSDVGQWNWIISTVDPVANSCPEPGASTGVIQSRPGAEAAGSGTAVTINATRATVSFDGLARGTADATFLVSAGGSGQCAKNAAGVRCLNVVVTAPGGEIRLCDPAVTSGSDPRKC